MTKRDAAILSQRPISQIQRIFENLDSLIDCLVLFEENLFERKNRRILVNFVLKVLRVSTYNVDEVVGMWKDFVLHVYRRACGTEVEDAGKPLVSNIFARLLREQVFIRYTNGLADKRMCENLAHLISTRNLANGGPRAEKQAIAKFKELTSVTVDLDRTAVLEHTEAGEYIGNLCLHLHGGQVDSTSHVSLTSSASLDSEVSNGGMAAEAIGDIMEYANGIPSATETLKLRFKGKSVVLTGGGNAAPRWKQICGVSDDAEFLSEKLGKILDRKVELWGADDHFGEVIFLAACHRYDAWKRQGTALPVRQVTISEPGGKARIVTCGPWWVQVAMQPYTHLLCQWLSRIPAAHSCLLRADQAWQSLSVWQHYPQDSLIPGHKVLSSDLKSATDLIDFRIAKAELRGFCEATNTRWIFDHLEPFISPRLVNYPDRSIGLTRRGIPMGEPLAKPLLILLGLCVERIALAHYLQKPVNDRLGNMPPWRIFHLGGDDHIAAGPPEYLNGITTQHRRVGGIPSSGKHGLSDVAVVYTEKLLYFKGMRIAIPMNRVDSVYEESIFIDSIKVRNISPFRKGCERENEVSSWIGKCKATANSIRYLKGPMKVKGRIAISRLQYRFGEYLPSDNHATLRAVCALPAPLGGLGLTTNEQRSFEKLPEIFRKALKVVADGLDVQYKVRDVLLSTWKPQAKRNVRIDDYSQHVLDQVLERFTLLSYEDVKGQLDPEGKLSGAKVRDLAKKSDIYTVDDLRYLTEKPYIVRQLLLGKQDDNSLRVAPMKVRLWRTWNELEKLELVTSSAPLEPGGLNQAMKKAAEPVFLDLKEITTVAVDEGGDAIDPMSDTVDWEKVNFVDLTLKQMFLRGAPDLSVRV
jgi:hypothetical protein